MGNLFKIVLFTAPVLALVFYFVLSSQERLDTEMRKQDREFSRDWNEFNAEFSSNRSSRQKYQSRAEEADRELVEIKKKEKEEEEKARKFRQEFEKQIEKAGQ